MTDRVKPEQCFVGVRMGDKFNKPYAMSSTARNNAKDVRREVGSWYVLEEGQTWRDGWKAALKENIRVRRAVITLETEL